MAIDHTEKGFEQAIESHLLSTGYIQGNPAHFSREYALDTVILFQFMKDTQPKAWTKLEGYYGGNVQQEVLKNICREMKERGSLDVIRHGYTDRGVKVHFSYFKPSSGLNEDTLRLYGQNVLTVTRQVHYSQKNENNVDMLISLNGFPIATIELKNHLFKSKFQQHLSDKNVPSELISRIVGKLTDLNKDITNDKKNLGTGFCIGHSYFCPGDFPQSDWNAWYERTIEFEVAPLLREYWFDDLEKAEKHINALQAD